MESSGSEWGSIDDFCDGFDKSWCPITNGIFIDTSCKKKYTSFPFKHENQHRRVYPKLSGLAACSENCEWYSSLPMSTVVSLFCEPV
jgi:hypothetical protein